MTQISDRYRRLAAGVADKISQVPPDKWEAAEADEQSKVLAFLGRQA